MALLETESDRGVDPAIVSLVAAAETAKTTARRSRLTKQKRSEVPDGIVQVGVIQNVLEVQRKRQVVTTAATAAAETTTAKSTTTTAAATWSTTAWTTGPTSAAHASHHHALLAVTPLPFLAVLGV